jgi:hypothetical protein
MTMVQHHIVAIGSSPPFRSGGKELQSLSLACIPQSTGMALQRAHMVRQGLAKGGQAIACLRFKKSLPP